MIDVLFRRADLLFEFMVINHDDKGKEDACEDKKREEMGPDVDTFVMEHEETSDKFSFGCEIDAIAGMNFIVILHVMRSSMIVTNV